VFLGHAYIVSAISLGTNFEEFITVWSLQREKEAALDKILKLEQQLNAKQKLELEIQQLQGKLEVMKHMPGEEDSESKKMDELTEKLQEKYDEMDAVESLNQTLVMKERKSNDELQHARKELINVSCHIGRPTVHLYVLHGSFNETHLSIACA
jgi:predicted nuclease with TOPRIM domain